MGSAWLGKRLKRWQARQEGRQAMRRNLNKSTVNPRSNSARALQVPDLGYYSLSNIHRLFSLRVNCFAHASDINWCIHIAFRVRYLKTENRQERRVRRGNDIR